MKTMFYKGKGTLGRKNEGFLGPIEIIWRDSKEKTGLGYLEKGYF